MKRPHCYLKPKYFQDRSARMGVLRGTLHGGDMERHLHALSLSALDHRAHDARRYTNDLRLVFWQAELEVLDEIRSDGLRLDNTVRILSEEWSSSERQDVRKTPAGRGNASV